MTLYEQFEAEFKPHLGHTKRWEAMSFIAKELLNTNRSINILETGCVRKLNNWDGDGQSTLLWDWCVAKTKGVLQSYDINADNVALARTQCTPSFSGISLGDSIKHLRIEQNSGLVSALSLLYLDSFDYSPGRYHLAELHHIGELACVYDKLPSGCLIAVDDCHSDTFGKHVLVKAFFDRINVQPLLKSYITVWRKP